jgi:antitoxin (DNA-binding transcriptional repressor) of toxin-antitoxin stability system
MVSIPLQIGHKEKSMKFLQVREIRTRYGKVLEQLRKEKKIVLTSKGKPVALLTELNEDNFEDRIADSSRVGFASEPSAVYTAENPEILKAWVEEAERRYEDYLAGKTKSVPAFEALEKIRKKHKK